MTLYQVRFQKSAKKELEKLPGDIVAKAFERIRILTHNPRPMNCKKLVGSRNVYRIRSGNYRVVYTIDDSTRVVFITRVAHRKEAYR